MLRAPLVLRAPLAAHKPPNTQRVIRNPVLVSEPPGSLVLDAFSGTLTAATMESVVKRRFRTIFSPFSHFLNTEDSSVTATTVSRRDGANNMCCVCVCLCVWGVVSSLRGTILRGEHESN